MLDAMIYPKTSPDRRGAVLYDLRWSLATRI